MSTAPTVMLVRVDDATEIVQELRVAHSWHQRFVGLLGQERLDKGAALWLRPCRSIHTLGMRFPIDVVFLDARLCVTAVHHHVRPGRLRIAPRVTRSTVELAAGCAAAASLVIGERLLTLPRPLVSGRLST